MEPALTDAVHRLRAAVPDLAAVYLFGSAADGQTHAASDLDLAVLAPRPLDPVARFDLAGDLAATLGRDVDLVDLAAASTVMRAEVVRTGRVIFDGDPTARANFEIYALGAYFDLNIERRGILADIRERGSVYG